MTFQTKPLSGTEFGLWTWPRTAALVLVAMSALPFFAGAQGCGDCTEIGCKSGVLIKTQNSEGQPVDVVDGTLVADGQTIEFSCTDEGVGSFSCENEGEVFLLDVQASTMTLTLRNEAGEEVLAQEFTGVQYNRNQPNGEDCDPVCLNGEITAQLL